MLQQVGDATAGAQAMAYGLTAQMISFANVSLNPTQGSNLDSLKSHKGRFGEDSSSAIMAQRWLRITMASAPTNG